MNSLPKSQDLQDFLKMISPIQSLSYTKEFFGWVGEVKAHTLVTLVQYNLTIVFTFNELDKLVGIRQIPIV